MSSDQQLTDSARRRLDEQYQTISSYTDRLFAILLTLQWIGAILMALYVAPFTWIGATRSLHPHIYLAIFGGGTLVSLPLLLVLTRPGRLETRMVVSISQMLFSSLLIHLSGGRIETHFHIFGSLAFLSAYRDCRVLVPATLIVAVDHFVRGVWWPQSVFGVATASEWRWLEHAAWVVFEDIFLFLMIRQSNTEMRQLAIQTGQLEDAAREAENANRAKSQFLANMSHEIRTPLSGILGFTEILLTDENGDPKEREEHLRIVSSSGQHLLALINDILDLSKIEAGQVMIEHVRCSPASLIEEVASALRVHAKNKNIDFEVHWCSAIPEVIDTDAHRLKQVLTNLIGNGIKFTDNGRVTLNVGYATRHDQGELQLQVADTGVGIASDKLEQIFKPFVQEDETVTRRFGGTGLGLAISHGIVKALGGTLTVNSIVGTGSCFEIRLPVGDASKIRLVDAATDAKSIDRLEQSAKSVDFHGLRFLVVDDGATNRKLASLLLRRAGAEVATAENGSIACEMIDDKQFDAVLLDMQMPVMDGYAAAASMRANGYARPIVALTAHAMKGDQDKCKRAGCSEYLAKPIDREKLFATLRELTETASLLSGGDETSRFPQSDSDTESENPPSTAYRSSLPADDPEIRDILVEFVDTLSDKLDLMSNAIEKQDYEQLARLAHWLKGAGGTVGFDVFTSPARDLEVAAKSGANSNAMNQRVAELVQMKGNIVI